MPPKKPVTKKRGRVENGQNEGTTTTKREKAGSIKAQRKRKVRKLDHDQANQPDQDQPMMDVKSEDESPTNENITHPPFIPHGILKLPQSIASALASDFLNNLEIRDLGLTCRWMLVSLNECVIREPITLQTAVRRLKRQRLSQSSTKVVAKTLALREIASRIPNLFIGKFTAVRFSLGHSGCLELPHINLLSDLGALVDTRVFILDFLSANYTKAIQKKFDQILPLALPPHLQELFIERDSRLPPLTQFQLPDSLKRISWKSNKFSSVRSNNFSQVQWPKGLKGLVNIYEPSWDGLPTEGLTTLSCDPKMTFGPNVTLPDCITYLNINWSSVTGRHYHDLPLPAQLKRLVLGCEITKNDFNLNEWVHLPKSCENFQITFSDSSPEFLLGPPDASTTATRNIIIPPFVRTLRVFYPNPLHSASRQSRLCLTHATSLIALETNQVDNIDWPTTSSTSSSGVGLSSLKLNGSGDDLITHLTTLPSTLQQLDLSEISDLDDMDLSKSGPLCQLFATVTKLRRLKVACWQDSPRVRQRVMNWSRELESCVIEFGIQPTDTTTTAQPNPRLTIRFSAYQAGELIQPTHDRSLAAAKKWTSERERYDPQDDLE